MTTAKSNAYSPVSPVSVLKGSGIEAYQTRDMSVVVLWLDQLGLDYERDGTHGERPCWVLGRAQDWDKMMRVARKVVQKGRT